MGVTHLPTWDTRMFPSSGFFKSFPCPFHDYGLCHRPYCHYKHVKRSVGDASVSSATPTVTPSLPTINSTPKTDVIEVQSKSLSPTDVTTPTDSPSKVTLLDIFGSSSSENDDNDIHEPINETPYSPQEDDTSPVEDLQLIQEKFKQVTKNEEKEEEGNVEESKKKEGSHDNKGIKKRRLAHNNDKVIRDPSVAIVTSTSKPKISTDEKLKEALNDPNAVYSGKKRQAHQPGTEVKTGTQDRPKLQTTINAKIPTKIRQQFLDSYIDEFVRMGVEPTEGYSKALEKERNLFQKCSSSMIYRNNSTRELMGLRRMADQEIKERKKRSDKRVKELLDTPTNKDLPLVKKGTHDSLSSKKVGLLKHKMAASLTNSKATVVGAKRPKMISIKNLLNDSLDAGSSVPPKSASSPSDKASSSNKIIPLKFYSSQTSKTFDDDIESFSCDEVGSSNRGEKREREVELPSAKSNKKMRKEISFEAALMNSSKKKKRKLLTNKTRHNETIKRSSKSPPSDQRLLPSLSPSDQRLLPSLSPSCKDTPLLYEGEEVCDGEGGIGDCIMEDVGHRNERSLSHDMLKTDSLINLSNLRRTNNTCTKEINLKKFRRSIDKMPVKPRPLPSFSILSKKEAEFNAGVFYSKLQKYLMTEEQLVDNGYPQAGTELGAALIKREKLIEPVLVESLGSNAMRHLCCRCGQGFVIYNQGEYQSVEECVYHFGRLIKSKEYGEGIISKYKCCGERRGSPGCQVAMMHVTAGTLLPTDNGYVISIPPPQDKGYTPQDKGYTPQVYSVDCEMVYTTLGLQLARITVVDMELKSVFESLVKPSHTIVDYNTRFSGLTAKDFVSVTTTINDVHSQLNSLIYSDTILIGHSLESDLKSMKLIHRTVVDTSLVFPHRNGPPFKRGLKDIMAEQLKKFIQDNVDGGHDSHEDAAACMELMVMKVKNDLQADTRRRPST